MKTLSMPIALAASCSLLLLAGWAMADRAPQSHARAGCVPAATSAVPADYLMYHALVAPQAALTDRRGDPASCAPRKVTRL